MRGGVGLIGLVLALALTGWLVRRQLHSTVALPPTVVLPAAPGGAGGGAGAGQAVPLNQLPEQTRQAVDALMQKPRPMPDD